MLFILSCEKENLDSIDDLSLIGKWSETVEAKPQGLLVYDLTLNDDSTFLLKIRHFGIYSGQNNQDLSAWSEFSGSFEKKDPNVLILKSKKYAWWDIFYEMTPILEDSNAQVFENCRYKISNNELELTYTTYPLDSPLETKKKLIRVK